ncbi:MAG: hypothetical protein K2I63_02030 [Helicobacter sp.]|nr:hypothetical protein [Helicobacter sp.]
MKKILFSTVLAASLLTAMNAATIDKNSITVDFQGYKTQNMVATAGTIKNGKFTFGKNENSITGIFSGAKATFSPKDIDMGVQLITDNIVNTFFKVLNGGKDFNVEIIKVLEADNQGSLTAKVTIGGQYEIIPLHYTIKDGKFVAKGTLDLFVFKNSANALRELSKVAPGHGGLSWSLVDITLSATIK